MPAEKKLIKRDSLAINHGTDAPPAKKGFKFLPVREKQIPANKMNTEKTITTAVSIMILILFI